MTYHTLTHSDFVEQARRNWVASKSVLLFAVDVVKTLLSPAVLLALSMAAPRVLCIEGYWLSRFARDGKIM
jgi:hypothetical protein